MTAFLPLLFLVLTCSTIALAARCLYLLLEFALTRVPEVTVEACGWTGAAAAFASATLLSAGEWRGAAALAVAAAACAAWWRRQRAKGGMA